MSLMETYIERELRQIFDRETVEKLFKLSKLSRAATPLHYLKEMIDTNYKESGLAEDQRTDDEHIYGRSIASSGSKGGDA